MGLKEDMLDKMSKQISNHIDWEILADVKISGGWTCVKLDRYLSNEHAVDIKIWIEENCTGKYDYSNTKFLFEKKQDAEWFILRWQ